MQDGKASSVASVGENRDGNQRSRRPRDSFSSLPVFGDAPKVGLGSPAAPPVAHGGVARAVGGGGSSATIIGGAG